MNKNFLMATVAGGVALLVLAGLLYGFLADFFANDIDRAVPILWALILGELVYAAVLTVALGWKDVANAKEGFQAGATIGALIGLSMALMGYATMEDVQTIATVFGHTLIAVVTSGVAGALIATLLNRGRG